MSKCATCGDLIEDFWFYASKAGEVNHLGCYPKDDVPADDVPTGHPQTLGEEHMFNAGYAAGYMAGAKLKVTERGPWPGDGACDDNDYDHRWSEWLPRDNYERRICDDCGKSEVRPRPADTHERDVQARKLLELARRAAAEDAVRAKMDRDVARSHIDALCRAFNRMRKNHDAACLERECVCGLDRMVDAWVEARRHLLESGERIEEASADSAGRDEPDQSDRSIRSEWGEG